MILLINKQELIQIRRILVQRRIKEAKNKIKALEELLDRLDKKEISKEVFYYE